MSANLTKAQAEYVATKFIKFENGGNNHVNVCPIEGELFWLVFGQPCGKGRFTFPTLAIEMMRGTKVEKFFAVNEKDISDNGWYRVADCTTVKVQDERVQ